MTGAWFVHETMHRSRTGPEAGTKKSKAIPAQLPVPAGRLINHIYRVAGIWGIFTGQKKKAQMHK